MLSSLEILQKPVSELKALLADIPHSQLQILADDEVEGKNRMVAIQIIAAEIKRRETVVNEVPAENPQNPVKKPKRYSLVISSSEKDSSDVSLSVNGNAILIQRDKKVEVGAEYIECLNHSTVNTIKRNPDTGKVTSVIRPRYMYHAEEIA